MTTRSVEQLNEKLERPVPTLQFRPNILVSTQQPFEEDKWEWIKIGERVVIRNVKPCSRYPFFSKIKLKDEIGIKSHFNYIICYRCKLVGVNPENGAMDKEEPLKTLKSYEYILPLITIRRKSRIVISLWYQCCYGTSFLIFFSFREQTDPDRISLEGRAPTMGIYCGLYVPGTVKIGDEVFIHSSNDSPVELNRREAAS